MIFTHLTLKKSLLINLKKETITECLHNRLQSLRREYQKQNYYYISL